MDPSDRQQILDLLAAVAYGYDTLDWDMYGSVWAEGALMDRGEAVTTGRTDIVESARTFRSSLAERGIQTRHYTAHTQFQAPSGDRVRARTMVFVAWQHAGEPAPEPKHTGLYHDEFVRAADGWRIASRTISLDHA